MPFTLLRAALCPTCGRTHTFALAGKPAARDYDYVCPETGTPATVRPDGPHEIARYAPQGAVALGDIRPTRAAA